jgi:hypothetical protein
LIGGLVPTVAFGLLNRPAAILLVSWWSANKASAGIVGDVLVGQQVTKTATLALLQHAADRPPEAPKAALHCPGRNLGT